MPMRCEDDVVVASNAIVQIQLVSNRKALVPRSRQTQFLGEMVEVQLTKAVSGYVAELSFVLLVPTRRAVVHNYRSTARRRLEERPQSCFCVSMKGFGLIYRADKTD